MKDVATSTLKRKVPAVAQLVQSFDAINVVEQSSISSPGCGIEHNLRDELQATVKTVFRNHFKDGILSSGLHDGIVCSKQRGRSGQASDPTLCAIPERSHECFQIAVAHHDLSTIAAFVKPATYAPKPHGACRTFKRETSRKNSVLKGAIGAGSRSDL